MEIKMEDQEIQKDCRKIDKSADTVRSTKRRKQDLEGNKFKKFEPYKNLNS